MIVAPAGRAEILLGRGTERVRIHCLARRGMLHSECEAFDSVRLSPGARFALVGRCDTEAAWFVLRGSVTLRDPVEISGRVYEGRERLAEGGLLLAPRGEDVDLRAGPVGAELLCLTTVPSAVAAALPPRSPDTVTRPTRPGTPTPTPDERSTP